MRGAVVLLLFVAGTSMAGVASGQTTPLKPEPLIPDQGRFVDQPAWSNPDRAVRAGTVIGVPVQDMQGNTIGKIDDLMVGRDGKVSHALVAIGPLPGLTGRKIVVPWSDVRFATAEERSRKAAPHRRTVVRLDDRVLDRALRYEPERDAEQPSASPGAPSR